MTLLAEEASSVIDAAERQLDATETLTRLLAASELLVQLTSVLAPGAQEAHARRILRDIELKVTAAQRVLIATPPGRLPGHPPGRPRYPGKSDVGHHAGRLSAASPSSD